GGCGHGGCRGEGGHGNHGHATADEVCHERRQAIVSALHPVVLNHHVLALDVTGFAEGFAEPSAKARRVLGRSGAEKADDRHRRLLRTRRERPRRRAAEQRDEVAAPHSITSSARPSSVGATSKPSVLAVWALITSSNLVDCTTGRSAGFSPLRMRPL